MIKRLIKQLKYISWFLDVLFLPVTIVSFVWFRIVKFIEIKRFPITLLLSKKFGVFPIVDHYYEPQFNFSKSDLDKLHQRSLPGLELYYQKQINFIGELSYSEELKQFNEHATQKDPHYYFHNGSFPSGDSELYYSVIRHFKPKKIIEIGSGFSTLISLTALEQNKKEGSDCEIVCVEPFENKWLRSLSVKLIESKVEDLPLTTFKSLNEHDILFIDSSHVIRPSGDVVHEILSILPTIEKGVVIHFHDIFTPRNYPEEWLTKDFRLWNEQYLLEAFLSNNTDFEVIAAMNYLKHTNFELLANAFPQLAKEPWREPGSFWIRKC